MRIEWNNCVEKFAFCIEKYINIVRNLKRSEKFAKMMIYFHRSENYSNCIAKISDKKCNLKKKFGSPLFFAFTVQKSYVEVLKRENFIKNWSFIKSKWIMIIASLVIFSWYLTKSSNYTEFLCKGTNKKRSND